MMPPFIPALLLIALSSATAANCDNTDGTIASTYLSCIPKILSTNYPAISSPSSNIDCLDDLDLEKATDICRDETDCTGFWLYDNGRTCFKSSYNDVAQVNWYCAVKYTGNIIVKTTYSLQEAQESLGVAQESLGVQQAIIPMTGTTAGDRNSLDQIWSGGSMRVREIDRDCKNNWNSWNCIKPMKDLCAAESPPLGKMYACEKKKKDVVARPPQYIEIQSGTCASHAGYGLITSSEECAAALAAIFSATGVTNCQNCASPFSRTNSGWPLGCQYHTLSSGNRPFASVNTNTAATGTCGWARCLCKSA